MRNAFARCLAVACLLIAPAVASAQDEEIYDLPDARLEGFPSKVDLPGGTAGTFFVLALCGGLCIAVMFKNSKRTHLD